MTKKTKKVLVILYGEIEVIPPVTSLVAALLDLGLRVTLLASHLQFLPNEIAENSKFEGVELGPRVSVRERFVQMYTVPRTIRNFLRERGSEFDAVWTTTDVTARAGGSELLKYRHIMQISELVEYVPAFANREMPFHSSIAVKLAQHATVTVVPEYNRAHIQKTWWKLSRTPLVLPNKPYPDPNPGEADREIKARLACEKRKILLYQGVYMQDRDLTPYAKAVQELGDEYALYMMGWGADVAGKIIQQLCHDYERVYDLGFIPSPCHLSLTPYGYIGVLPYVPGKTTRSSELNALYCAPNKIWEYSRFGLPMIGSDVPGLTNIFEKNKIGCTVDSVDDIVKAVKKIDSEYDLYSKNSSRYYDLVNYKEDVAAILEKAGV